MLKDRAKVMDAISFFIAPLLMCFILVAIHCYLGLHVLKRGVIFVDLSLAQVAGLGSTIALLFHLDHDSKGAYFISLICTFIAAALFAWGRRKENIISQEVLIGLVYAFSSAMVVLVVNNLAHGAEHIKEILIGKILWVGYSDVYKTLCIYSLVAVIHFVYRHKFFAVTRGEDIQNRAFWDFLFFALFGVVIASSVNVAGILLVFSFLIVPSLLATMFTSSIRKQVWIGFGLGAALSSLGMFVSYKMDYPAGAVLVVIFTIVPLMILPFRSSADN